MRTEFERTLALAGINVVVVTGSLDRARWGEAVRLGARKVLAKSRPLNDVLATVRRNNQGLQVMAPALADDRAYRVAAAYEVARDTTSPFTLPELGAGDLTAADLGATEPVGAAR